MLPAEEWRRLGEEERASAAMDRMGSGFKGVHDSGLAPLSWLKTGNPEMTLREAERLEQEAAFLSDWVFVSAAWRACGDEDRASFAMGRAEGE